MAEIDLSTAQQRWVGWVVVAATLILGSAIFLVISAFNTDHMALVVEDGRLYVEKGDFLPWGRSLWEPSEAFAPVDLPDDLDVELSVGECDDRAHCERRFYRSLIAVSGALLEEPEPTRLARAKELIVRAQLFPSISLADRAPLEDLTGGVHYVEALVILEDVRAQLELAHKKLERSRIATVPFAEQDEIERLVETVEQQLYLLETRRPSPSASQNSAENPAQAPL